MTSESASRQGGSRKLTDEKLEQTIRSYARLVGLHYHSGSLRRTGSISQDEFLCLLNELHSGAEARERGTEKWTLARALDRARGTRSTACSFICSIAGTPYRLGVQHLGKAYVVKLYSPESKMSFRVS